jgi:hypothetical protein
MRRDTDRHAHTRTHTRTRTHAHAHADPNLYAYSNLNSYAPIGGLLADHTPGAGPIWWFLLS